MCARRFLFVVFFLTLMIVAGAFAIYQWGGDVLIQQAVPKGHFTPPPPRSGPDYSMLNSWIAHPQLDDDPSRWVPEGMTIAPGPGSSAVFYIHPTTYLQRDRWNAALRMGGDSDFRASLFVQSQASAFNNVGQIWAPAYRQAAYGAFLLRSVDAQKALNLAFSDVSAAFDEFLKHVRDGQPIILAGHSQGALHLMRLAQERKEQLDGRVVAAYVVGWPISTAADLPALVLPACQAPDQTGCILSWMSFGEPANPTPILADWEKSTGLTNERRRRSEILCVNPLTGTQGGAATAQANPGTLVPSADLRSASILPGQVGARCDEGLLTIDGKIPPLGPYLLPGNNYHVYDYALFWGAIRRDAEQRLAAWQRR